MHFTLYVCMYLLNKNNFCLHKGNRISEDALCFHRLNIQFFWESKKGGERRRQKKKACMREREKEKEGQTFAHSVPSSSVSSLAPRSYEPGLASRFTSRTGDEEEEEEEEEECLLFVDV